MLCYISSPYFPSCALNYMMSSNEQVVTRHIHVLSSVTRFNIVLPLKSILEPGLFLHCVEKKQYDLF